MADHLDGFVPLGYTWNGKLFLMGRGEVTPEEFNAVVGGDLGNGWHLSFEVSDEEESGG